MEAPTKIDETAKNAKVLKEISKVKSGFNPDPSRFIKEQDSGMDLIVEKAYAALENRSYQTVEHVLSVSGL